MTHKNETEALSHQAQLIEFHRDFDIKVKEHAVKMQYKYESKIARLHEQLAERDHHIKKLRTKLLASNPDTLQRW